MTLGRPLAGAEAIRRAVHQGGADGDVTWVASTVPGFPNAWYVTGTKGGRPLIGGAAYVAHKVTGAVMRVPAGAPPHVYLERSLGHRSADV